MRAARHRLSQERLRALLGLPHDATITSVVVEPGSLAVTVTSTSRHYPDTPENYEIEVLDLP